MFKGVFFHYLNFHLVSEWVHLLWFKYLSMILDPLCLFAMDCALHASLHDLVGDECNMPCVYENISMSIYPNMLVMTCYMTLYMLLKFQMSNS